MMDNRFKFVCRVCLVQDSTAVMCSLANHEIRETLFECTSVLITPGDKYPQQLCEKCWNKCWIWSNFKALAQESDRQLKTEGEEKELDDRDELMCDGDIVIVKEEQMVYLEGYSLAPEEQQLRLENGVMCGDGDDEVVVELKLEIDEEEEGMVEFVKGNLLNAEEQSDYPPMEDEEEQSTIKPLVGDAVEEEQKMRERASKVKNHQHKCRYCSRGFPTSSKLIRHERVHTNERPFQCKECGQKFKEKSHLRVHKLSHSRVKAFKCDECGQKFGMRCNLTRHKRIHAGVKAFECDQCHSKFSQKSHLVRHRQTHLKRA